MTKSSPFRGVTLFRPTGKWRAQISALGRTVSLGDHDTEEEAARAFDRAAINKGGRAAKTNFPTVEYEAEVSELTGLSQEELVAMLRSRARKNGSQASTYCGVSLLRQTGRWHAQIILGGKQVHLGYFLSEQLAAKAFDRAAIIKGVSDGQTPATNLDMVNYDGEMKLLKAMDQTAFVNALADEGRQQGLMDMLAHGFTLQGARAVFGPSFMQPDSKASAAQARASKTQRQPQAPQQDPSVDQSASTSKVSTRKRKLADASCEAATAAAAAAATNSTAVVAPAALQASTAPLPRQTFVSISDAIPAEVNHTVTQPASNQSQVGSQAGSQARNGGQSKAKRRSSRHHAGSSSTAQAPSAVATIVAASEGDQQQSTDKTNQDSSKLSHPQGTMPPPPDDTKRVAVAAPAAAGRSAFRESARKEADRLQTQSEVRGDPARQEQIAAPHPAFVGPLAGRCTRSGSVGCADMKALATAGAPSGSHEKQSDAEQSVAGEVVGSERDKRVSARRLQAAPKPNFQLGGGTAASSAAPNHDGPSAQQQHQAPAQAMASSPNSDAVSARKAKHNPTAPAVKATKRAQRAKTPVADIEASGSGDQARVSGSQQEAAAARQSAQDEEQPSVNGSAVAKIESSVIRGALGAASHSTAAAATITRAKEAAAPGHSHGTTGKPCTAGMPGTAGITGTAGTRSKAATAGQLSTVLNAGQSHGTFLAIQEPVRATDPRAENVPKAPDTAAAMDLAVPVKQTSANADPPHQTCALAHPPQGPPSSSSPSAASGAAPNSLGPTTAALAASSRHDAPAPTGVNLASPPDASAVHKAESAKTTAAAQEATAPPARCGVTVPVESAIRNHSEPSQGFCAQQEGPAEMTAAAAASAEATRAAALASGDAGALADQAAAFQGSSPSGVQSEPLPTPRASPTAATPSFTPLTAQAASIAERSSLDAGAGQALFQPWALDSSSRPVTTAPGPATLASSLAPIPSALNVATDAQKGRPPLTVSPSTATTAGVSSAAGVTSPRARSSELKLNSRTQQAGSRSEAISSGSGAVPSRTGSASTAIAAAARANAAAANAIAESGALANGSFPGASGQLPGPRMGEGFGSVARSFTVPANNPPAHGASGPLSAAATASQKHLLGTGPNGYAGNSANGPLLSGAFATSRSGPLAAGQASAMSASQPDSMPMIQQQRLNGTAFMTAMQQSAPASSIQGPFHGVAASTAPTAAALRNSSHNKSESGQQPAAYLGPGQKSQAFSNPNFTLPSGPASFSSNPSPGGTSLPGSSVNPNFVSTSSTLNPGPPGNPAAPRQHYSASGLSNSSPNPIITKPAGPHVATGNPVSPSYQPQGLRAAALESGNQAISPAAPQGSWSKSKTPFHGMPTPAQSQGSLPAGAQVTPATARPQPMPQLPPSTSLAPQLPEVQSRGMTNAHAIVPGMPPSSAGRGPNTAWQVGLAAGLAATANLRPPNPSLGHQAATTAAAARAAAAFQASRALSMAKSHSQQSPLLQQGSVGANVSGPAATANGANLAGPSTKPSSEPTSQAPSTAASSRPLITHGEPIDSTATATAGAATATSGAVTHPSTAAAAAAVLPNSSFPIASHQAFARQALPPAAATAGANHPTGRPMMPPSAYSAEAQALYRARAQQQQPYGAQARPYLTQTQPGGALQPSYVSLSQPPYNVQTHTPYIAHSQVPYVAPSQSMYKPPPQAPYGATSMYPTAAAAQARYATATQRYAATASQLRPPLRPQLNVEHFNFAKLAPQPKSAIDIICEDAVLPTFPLKKKKPKKRKLAGFEVFAADVAKHKRIALDSRSNLLHRRFSKGSPVGRPPKDFRPRAPSAAQQAEQRLAKASSLTSLAGKPKGKAAKGTKGKQAAAAKGTKGKKGSKAADDDTPRKRSDRVKWNAAGGGKRRSVEQAPSGRQFADAARLHQEAVGTSGLEQLLGVLEEEFSDFEQAQTSDSDDGQVSGTEQGGPSRASASGRGRGSSSGRRSKAPKAATKASGVGRGRGRVKGATESAAGKGVKVRKRAASSSPDRGPLRSNRRKIQPPSRD